MIVYYRCCVNAGASLNIKGNDGRTALAIALRSERERVVDILRAAGNYHACGR